MGGGGPGRHRATIEDLAFAATLGVAARLPTGLALQGGRWLGRLAYLLVASRRRIALHNLRQVYGDRLDERELGRLARASFESLGLLVVDFAGLTRLTREEAGRRVQCEGFEHFERGMARGRGVLHIGAHLGSWELLPHVHALEGHPLAFVARPADNPRIEARLRRIREHSGNRVIAKKQAAREVLRTLQQGGVVGILIDQAVSPERGVLTSFLGREAYTTPAPAQFALRTGAAVVPAFLEREADPRRHRLTFGPEVELVRTGDRERDVVENTRRFVQAIEQRVQQAPEQWLWCHRRWREPASAPSGQSALASSGV